MKKIYFIIIFILLAILGYVFFSYINNNEEIGEVRIEGDQVMLSDYSVWTPALGTTWQWHLTDDAVDQSYDVEVYDIELFSSSAELVSQLHKAGRKVICYMSVGTYEDWRPDARKFPKSVIGKPWPEWPGESWLDIRQIDLLAPIMQARLDDCKNKGFDAVEPDNMDGYDNKTGFKITYADQLRYNKWLANEAHKRGLSIGLKNNSEQVEDLLPYFDWALTEDCFQQGWCEDVLPFIKSGKAVFSAEYTDVGMKLNKFCNKAKENKISAILKHRDLDAYMEACK